MKSLVILTDTHGNTSAIEKIKHLFGENDYIIHLGDNARDMSAYYNDYYKKMYLCKGNCDLFSFEEEEYIIEVEQCKILLCHGHRYGVKSGLDELSSYAKSKGCNIALYGHTHRADIQTINGVTLINAGCMSLSSYKKSYCYLVINKDKAVPTIVDLQ